MLKGTGVGSIIKLVLALMVASLFISVATLGSLGDALQESFGNIGDATDFTAEIEDVEGLSDITMFSRDRAVNEGCDVVDKINDPDEDAVSEGDPRNIDYGYPGLEDTTLGNTPPCFGGETGALRDGWELTPGRLGTHGEDENYMPGIYSREEFEITDEILLDTNNGNYWLENELGNVVAGSPEDLQQELDDEDDGLIDTVTGTIGGAVDGTIDWIQRDSVVYGFLADAPETEVSEAVIFLKDPSIDLEKRTNLGDVDLEEVDPEDIEFTVQLCEGDRGYVQSNREYYDYDGVTSSDPLHPIIVIEETEMESCGEDVGEPEPYSGPHTGNQIFIHAEQSLTSGHQWPDVEAFELKQVGERQGREWALDDAEEMAEDENKEFNRNDYTGNSNRCEIYFRDETRSGEAREATLRTYDIGTLMERDHNDFTDSGLEFSSSTHRWRSRLGTGNPPPTIWEEYPAFDLMNEMSTTEGGTGLDSQQIDDPGELHVETSTGISINQLYGDLVCANPDDSNYAEWHLCDEGLDEDLKEVETEDGTWSCDAEEGEWNLVEEE